MIVCIPALSKMRKVQEKDLHLCNRAELHGLKNQQKIGNSIQEIENNKQEIFYGI